jgi:hypothetical protein
MVNKFYFIIYKNIPKSTQKISLSTFEYIKKFLGPYDQLAVVDARILTFRENKENIYSYKSKNVEFVKIKKFKDFFKLLNKNSYCFTDLNYTFRDYILFFFIKLKRFKIILFNNIGYYSQATETQKKKIFFFDFLIIFFNHIIFKILLLVSLLPRIYCYFESSQTRINSLNRSLSKNLQKIFFLKNIFYFKKIIRINSKYFDKIKNDNNKKINEEKYVVYVDNGFDHPDRILVDGQPKDKDRRIYFEQLSKFLNQLGDYYKCNVIFCCHPKSPTYKKGHYFYELFNFCKITCNTDYYLERSKVVIFQISSLINKAILINKRIILTKSDLLGTYFNEKLSDLNAQIDLVNVDLSRAKDLNFSKIEKELKKKIKFYSYYITKNHVINKNINSFEQIKKYLQINRF